MQGHACIYTCIPLQWCLIVHSKVHVETLALNSMDCQTSGICWYMFIAMPTKLKHIGLVIPVTHLHSVNSLKMSSKRSNRGQNPVWLEVRVWRQVENTHWVSTNVKTPNHGWQCDKAFYDVQSSTCIEVELGGINYSTLSFENYFHSNSIPAIRSSASITM